MLVADEPERKVCDFKVGKSTCCLSNRVWLTISWASEGRFRNQSLLQKYEIRYLIFRP